MVNYDGVVYEKNLKSNTTAIAQSMTKFNPEETWKKLCASLETGENHPGCGLSSSTAWRSDRTPAVRVQHDFLMTTGMYAVYCGVHTNRTKDKE